MPQRKTGPTPSRQELPTESLALGSPLPITVLGSLEEEAWFDKLSDDEKLKLKQEDEQLGMAMQYAGRSRLAAAAHLTHIYDILGPLKVFERYIKRYHLKRRSAYRAIKSYKHAQSLPDAILNVAMARNVNIMGETEKEPFGVYTDAVKKLPPPSKPTEAQAAEYLDMLEAKRKSLPKPERGEQVQEVLGPTDPKDLLRECYRFVDVRFRRLPAGTTTSRKTAWMKNLCGMLLQRAGISGEPVIAVTAPPADFKAVRGRPKSSIN